MKHIEGDLKCQEHNWGGDWHDMFTHLTEIKHETLKAEYSDDGRQRIIRTGIENPPLTKDSWRWRLDNGVWTYYGGEEGWKEIHGVQQ